MLLEVEPPSAKALAALALLETPVEKGGSPGRLGPNLPDTEYGRFESRV